jgi:hypothetical protein
MYTKSNFGFSDDFLKSVAKVMSSNRNMTVAEIQEKVDSGRWSLDSALVEGKDVNYYDKQLNRRFSVYVTEAKGNDVDKDKEGTLDPVKPNQLKKDSAKDREDDDIDNDGDSDDSDEYLHNRRKAISKAMKEEEEVDEDAAKERRIAQGRAQVMKNMRKDDDAAKERRIAQGRAQVMKNMRKEEVELEEAIKPYVSLDRDGAHVLDSKGKTVKTFQDMKTANAYLHKNFKSLSEDPNLEEGKKGYKKESEEEPKSDEKMTDAQKNDMDGDGAKDKKSKKKKDEKEKVDTVDTDPEMEDDTMVQEANYKGNLSSHEKDKLYDLKKKHEGGKMHRNLRKQYGEKGDDIFYGKLTKMAKGEYDGSDSKNEEFRLTVEDLNHLEELAMLGERRPAKTDDADDGGSKNLIMQLRKAVSLRGQHTVVFDDGSKVKVDARKAQTFLDKFNSLNKPVEKETLMKSASKSPKHLDMALQGKVSKLSTGRRMPELPPLGSEKK